MVARLWWVRHGPTHARAFTGWRDIPADLSDAAALARLDAHLPSDALVVSSDLVRASATADFLSRTRPRLPDQPDLREFDFGAWDGRVFDDIAATDPDLSRAYWETPGDLAAPGGESWNGVARRVSSAISRLVAAHPGADLVAVAHMGVIMTHLSDGAGLSPTEAMSHRIEPLSVTRLDRTGTEPEWQIMRVNHCP